MAGRQQTSPCAEKQAKIESYAAREALKMDASNNIAATLLAALGTGVLGRTLVGAGRMRRTQPSLYRASSMYPIIMPDMIPAPKPKKKKKVAALPAEPVVKVADGPPAPITTAAPAAAPTPDLNPVSKLLYKTLFHSPPGARESIVRGDAADNKWGIPTYAPLLIGGGLAALYGGYKVTDKLFDARRKAEIADEVEEAQETYLNAVRERLKQSSDVQAAPVADVFDVMATQRVQQMADTEPAAHTKSAAPDWLKHYGGGAAGLYALYALLASVGAGKMTYDAVNKRSPRKITEKALTERTKQRYNTGLPTYISQNVDSIVHP